MNSIINENKFINMLLHANNMLSENKEYLNTLNVFPVPDGDTGTNMAATFEAGIKAIQEKEDTTIESIATDISKGTLLGARGNSGVILSQIIRGFAAGLKGYDELNVQAFNSAFESAQKYSYKAVMKPKEGTILSVIRASSESAKKNSSYTDVNSFLKVVLDDAKTMLEQTREMLPENKNANTVDAGGAGLIIILQSFLDVAQDNVTTTEFNFNKNNAPSNYIDIHPAKEDIKFQYCTEFIMKASVNESIFKDKLSLIGDCVVVVSFDNITKVHIHTNKPNKALEYALNLGDITNIKIDNMKEQAEHNSLNKAPKKTQSVVAVSSGEGISDVFLELGVDYIISGGQSTNPSVDDILSAIEKVNAENIILLPNNKNIILSAEQAASLSQDNVFVLSTKNIPQGLTAAQTFNQEYSFEENCNNMRESFLDVVSCQVTTAVKNSKLDGLDILEGQVLGIKNDKIVCNNVDSLSVITELFKISVTEDVSLATIIYGQNITQEYMNEIAEILQNTFTEIDIITVDGKQDIYPFIISFE